MIQNPYNQAIWSGSFWSSESGWYQLTLANDQGVSNLVSDKWFFVQKDSSWNSFYLNRICQQFKQFTFTNSTELTNKSPVLESVEVDRVYFFAIFLVSCGLLWNEHKL